MIDTPLTVEPSEMQRLVETLGVIGEQPGGGIIRHVYDSAWVAARQQLADWMRAAGLTVRSEHSQTKGKQAKEVAGNGRPV